MQSQPKAFTGSGISTPEKFLEYFLSSPDFSKDTLVSLCGRKSSKLDKKALVQRLLNNSNKPIDLDKKILQYWVTQTRDWLSFKMGDIKNYPTKKDPQILLHEFGEDTWYGPIYSGFNSDIFYVRTKKVRDYIVRGTGDAAELDHRDIRWAVIAKVTGNCVALSWNNFGYHRKNDDSISIKKVEYPYWYEIEKFWEEIEAILQTTLKHPNLNKLVLDDLWDKYLSQKEYVWHHLRIRADNAGVALNAHSSQGIQEMGLKGLQALSNHLADSVIHVLPQDPLEKLLYKQNIEDAILRTLIREWGTKSYEFALDYRDPVKGKQMLFKAHCYFSNEHDSNTGKDSLQHLYCRNKKYYGGSNQALDFLLTEINLRESGYG